MRVCKEIPFIDAPEGACVWTVTHKEELINAKDWAAMRPYSLILDPDGWKAIKTSWLQACQMAMDQGEACNIEVDSVDQLVRSLDALAGAILGPL